MYCRALFKLTWFSVMSETKCALTPVVSTVWWKLIKTFVHDFMQNGEYTWNIMFTPMEQRLRGDYFLKLSGRLLNSLDAKRELRKRDNAKDILLANTNIFCHWSNPIFVDLHKTNN